MQGAFVHFSTDLPTVPPMNDWTPRPEPDEIEENRFECIREAAAEQHKKADTDGARRRARQTAEDNRLIWE